MDTFLEASNLECLRGEHRLFHGLSFELRGGSLMRVEGANGSGKTSLLRMLCGLTRPSVGQIRWQGSAIEQLGDSYLEALFYLGHQNALKEELNAIENLRLSAALHGIALQEESAFDALDRFGLGASAQQLPVRALSQGQKRRAALAGLGFRGRMPIWLLDEAFVGLDSEAVQQLARMIEAHLARNGIVIYTTHQDVPLRAPHSSSIRLQ